MNQDEKIDRFNAAWRALDAVYGDYAKTVGMSYTSLHLLNLITITDQCTQSFLCERTFLPKQTVNFIVTGFYRQGWVELHELPEDRRIKTIHLTAEGRKVSDAYVAHITNAEHQAMASLPDEQSELLIQGMLAYGAVFRARMLADQ